MAHAVVGEHAANLDSLLGSVGAVGIDQQGNVVTERFPHLRYDCLGTTRPLVLVVTALLANADLEGIEAMLVTQPHQALDFVLGCDVAAHAGAIHRQRARRTTEKLTYALTFALAAQIPQRRVETGQRPAHVGAGKLELDLDNAVEQRVDVASVLTERVGCDLTVYHPRSDVGVVG